MSVREVKAFLIGVVTYNEPYITTWTSFDELSAYELGREGTRRILLGAWK